MGKFFCASHGDLGVFQKQARIRIWVSVLAVSALPPGLDECRHAGKDAGEFEPDLLHQFRRRGADQFLGVPDGFDVGDSCGAFLGSRRLYSRF